MQGGRAVDHSGRTSLFITVYLENPITWPQDCRVTCKSRTSFEITNSKFKVTRLTCRWTSVNRIKVKIIRPHKIPARRNWTPAARSLFNCLTGTPLYSNTVMWLVHWPLMDGLLHLVQRGESWVRCGTAQFPSHCTKCNNPLINGQCTNFDVALYICSLEG